MNRGFALAEILITLGIIGVVSAITLPIVAENYQKQITVNKLKKSYTNLQNAIQLSINENGDMSTWDFSDNLEHSGVESKEFFRKYIVPYYNDLKNPKFYSKSVWNINGTMHPADTVEYLLLPDGTSLGISLKYQSYIWVHIDINGEKGPNRLGKDVFLLLIYPKKNKLTFKGQGLTNEKLKNYPEYGEYDCAKTDLQYAGGYCGAKIMQDGWKISDDYPW